MEKKRIATLFLIVLADMSGAAAIIPIIPVYVLAQFHATPFQAALVITAYYVAQVLAAPLLGNLSDRFGRRPILLVSQAGTIVSYLLIVLAVPLGALVDHVGLRLGIGGGLVVIYLARILDGVTGGNISVAQAYASDISTPEERTRALGLVGGASGLGHILGPALAGVLAGINLLTPFIAAAVVSGVTVLLTLLWLHEPLRREDGLDQDAPHADGVLLSQVLLRRPVMLILVMALVIGLYMAALFGTFALYADRVLLPGQPEAQVVRTVGLIITVMGLVTALTQVVLLKPLVSHLGEHKTVLLGSFLLLVSAGGFFAVSELGAIMVFVIAFALGYGTVWPTLQSLITSFGTEQMAGRLLGWFQSVFSLALILGPVWGLCVRRCGSAGGLCSERRIDGARPCSQRGYAASSDGLAESEPENSAHSLSSLNLHEDMERGKTNVEEIARRLALAIQYYDRCGCRLWECQHILFQERCGYGKGNPDE